MSMNVKTFERFVELGGSFCAWNPCGGTINLRLDEVEKYVDDPEAFAADIYCVAVDELRDFITSGGFVQCSGITSHGLRCRCTGPGAITPREWKDSTWLCSKHKGQTAEDMGDRID